MMVSILVVEPCKSSNAMDVRLNESITIDFEKLENILKGKRYEVLARTPLVMLLKYKDKSISIYKSGRMLVKGLNKDEAEAFAAEFYEEIKEAILI